MADTVDVVLPAGVAQSVDVVTGGITSLAQNTPIVAVTLEGPAGPSGAAASSVVFVQAAPAASVAIPHTFGRLPAVELYVAGELIEADVTANTTFAYIAFAQPTAFTAILT